MAENWHMTLWGWRGGNMDIPIWAKQACFSFVLCATTAIALPAQTFTTLHSFDGTDGFYLNAGLVQGTDGNLYGTTQGGGANGYGTVFRITPSGTLTMLYSFCSQSGCTDGEEPYAGLVQGTDGNFYGTTVDGGTNNNGTLFRLSVGLGPFVKTQPPNGKVGAAVEILGTNLTGATSVSFNG